MYEPTGDAMTDGTRVLLVDDGPDADAIAASLEAASSSLIAASTPSLEEDGILDDVDCLVIAHDPPGVDSFALLESARSRDVDTPVALLDRKHDESVASAAIEAGAAEYVRGGVATETPAVLANRLSKVADAARIPSYEAERNMLDAMFEHIPVYLYVKDEEARHVRVSNEFDAPEDIIGKTDLETHTDQAAEQFYADDMRVIEHGEHVVNREESIPSEGRYQLASKVPWRDAEGEIQGLIGVTREITDLKRYQQQLERQNERLRRLAGVISHDVRNPLQVATSKIDLARSECDSAHLDGADAALGRMDDLIDDLLTMVRQGQWVEETEPMSLRAVVTGCWDAVMGDDGTLTVEDDVEVRASDPRFRQLMDNLLRNALVHGGIDVAVTVGPLDDDAGFYVEDDGPGIPPDEREDVFTFGYTTDRDGCGLGLAIVNAIADAHGWTITVTEGTSGGARFELDVHHDA